MMGTLIIILLIASIVVLSTAFLLVALWMGKGFNQIGHQNPQPDHQRRHSGSRR